MDFVLITQILGGVFALLAFSFFMIIFGNKLFKKKEKAEKLSRKEKKAKEQSEAPKLMDVKPTKKDTVTLADAVDGEADYSSVLSDSRADEILGLTNEQKDKTASTGISADLFKRYSDN